MKNLLSLFIAITFSTITFAQKVDISASYGASLSDISELKVFGDLSPAISGFGNISVGYTINRIRFGASMSIFNANGKAEIDYMDINANPIYTENETIKVFNPTIAPSLFIEYICKIKKSQISIGVNAGYIYGSGERSVNYNISGLSAGIQAKYLYPLFKNISVMGLVLPSYSFANDGIKILTIPLALGLNISI